MRNLKTATTTQGNFSTVLMLTSFFFFFFLISKGTNHAVLLFLPLSPHDPLPFFPFVCLLLSSHLFFIQLQTPRGTHPQSAEWGFTARCWNLWPAVNVHPTVWHGRQEPLLAVVRTDTIRLTPILPIWPAHVRIEHLYICISLLVILLLSCYQ